MIIHYVSHLSIILDETAIVPLSLVKLCKVSSWSAGSHSHFRPQRHLRNARAKRGWIMHRRYGTHGKNSPDAPCMEYLPTCRSFWWDMLIYILAPWSIYLVQYRTFNIAEGYKICKMRTSRLFKRKTHIFFRKTWRLEATQQKYNSMEGDAQAATSKMWNAKISG